MVTPLNTFYKKISLDKAIHMCQAQEAAKKQRAAMQQGSSHLHESHLLAMKCLN